jgi:hypothetical protein
MLFVCQLRLQDLHVVEGLEKNFGHQQITLFSSFFKTTTIFSKASRHFTDSPFDDFASFARFAAQHVDS